MKPENKDVKILEDVRQLNRCMIKITFPNLKSGLWVMSNLNKIITVRVQIRCLRKGMKGVVYDNNITAELRDILHQFCTTRALMPNIEPQKYSKKSVVYWMPLIPNKENLDTVLSSFEGVTTLDDYEATVEYTLCKSVADLAVLDEEETEIIAEGPVVIEFRSFETSSDIVSWGCTVSF